MLSQYFARIYLCEVNKKTNMFQQFIGDGASLFITIVAVLVGFATALGYLDFMKTKKEQKKED